MYILLIIFFVISLFFFLFLYRSQTVQPPKSKKRVGTKFGLETILRDSVFLLHQQIILRVISYSDEVLVFNLNQILSESDFEVIDSLGFLKYVIVASPKDCPLVLANIENYLSRFQDQKFRKNYDRKFRNRVLSQATDDSNLPRVSIVGTSKFIKKFQRFVSNQSTGTYRYLRNISFCDISREYKKWGGMRKYTFGYDICLQIKVSTRYPHDDVISSLTQSSGKNEERYHVREEYFYLFSYGFFKKSLWKDSRLAGTILQIIGIEVGVSKSEFVDSVLCDLENVVLMFAENRMYKDDCQVKAHDIFRRFVK